MRWSLRALVLASATALASGCGSSDERPEGPDGGVEGGQPVAAAAEYHSDGYQGGWDDGSGTTYAVEDDGSSVSGTLRENVDGRLSQVDFQLARKRDGLKGTAQIETGDGNVAEVRWELLPSAGGNLKGRQQTAWLDEETGEVVTFDTNPLWEPLSVSIARGSSAEPTQVAMADPVDEEQEPIEDDPEDDPFEDDPEDDPFADDPEDDPFADDPGMEDDPEDDPFADDPEDDPFADDPEDDPFEDDPSPTLVDEPEDDIELQADEEARAEAEAAAKRAARQRERAEASREQRKDSEGLAQTLMNAINGRDGRLYMSCWIINDDARFLAGAREAEVIEIARGQMQDVWGTLTKVHPGITKGEFVRFEGNVQRGKKTNEVRDGLLVYRLPSGEEKSLNLTLLVEVEDGSWKVQDLEP